MTKRELTQELASRSGIRQELAADCIESIMDSLFEALVAGENVYLRSFGTFALVERKAKKARNIKAGTTVEVPAHKVVKFIPCPVLKQAVR